MTELNIPSELQNLYDQAREDAKKKVPRYPYAHDVVALIERVAKAEQVLRDLVIALGLVLPACNSAIVFQTIHGMPYTGPTIDEELKQAKTLLGIAE